MEKIITYENFRDFTYSNDKLIKGKINGIILEFSGHGTTRMIDNDTGDALEYAERGIIYLVPYYNPWSWMNRQSVRLIDELIDVVCVQYSLNPRKVKIASTGLSMGGLAAIVYCAYAKITPCMCVANCPVCDLPFHFTEKPNIPHSLYSAFGEYECSFEDALKSASPLHIVKKLPDIPYIVFHCERDEKVDIEKHSVRFVEEMLKEGRQISFNIIPLRRHCDLSAEMRLEYKNVMLEHLS